MFVYLCVCDKFINGPAASIRLLMHSQITSADMVLAWWWMTGQSEIIIHKDQVSLSLSLSTSYTSTNRSWAWNYATVKEIIPEGGKRYSFMDCGRVWLFDDLFMEWSLMLPLHCSLSVDTNNFQPDIACIFTDCTSYSHFDFWRSGFSAYWELKGRRGSSGAIPNLHRNFLTDSYRDVRPGQR